MPRQPIPQMKSEIASGDFNAEWYWINFHATPDAASEMEKFGRVTYSELVEYYTIWVDRRFDLFEVLAYIRDYGKEQP